jgi:hypothetical protein
LQIIAQSQPVSRMEEVAHKDKVSYKVIISL